MQLVWAAGCSMGPAPTRTAPTRVKNLPGVSTILAQTIRTAPSAADASRVAATPTPMVLRMPAPGPTLAAAETNVPTPVPTPAPPATEGSLPRSPEKNMRPPPQVQSFDPAVFIDCVNRAHGHFQKFLAGFNLLVEHKITGSCRWLDGRRREWGELFWFSEVPAAWKPLHDEYQSLIEQAFEVTASIYSLCQGTGGTVDEATDRRIIEFFDRAQNRLHQIALEAEAAR